MDPAAGRDHDSVELAVLGGVVDGGAAAQDVDGVGGQQAAPRLAVLVAGLGLLGGEVGAGQDERPNGPSWRRRAASGLAGGRDLAVERFQRGDVDL